MIFYNSSHKKYMQCVPDPTPKYPRKRKQTTEIKQRRRFQYIKFIQDLLSVHLIYNFHNPSHTPSQKLISITLIKFIKIIYTTFIKIFIKLIYKILYKKFHKNSTKFYKNSIQFLENPQEYPQIYPKFTPNFIKFLVL